jgi:hypothetical protein
MDTWITNFKRPEGLGAWTHIIRCPNDPERLSRKERQDKFPDSATRWKKDLKTTPENIAAWREKICEVLSDGRRRTFNHICLEASGYEYTADVAFRKAPDRALWELIGESKIQCTSVAPIRFLLNPDPGEIV